MAKKKINTTIDEDMYNKIQILALILSKETGKKINTNELIEQGLRTILTENKDKLSNLQL